MALANDPIKQLTYEIEGQTITTCWVTENDFSIPKNILVIDDTFSADRYISLASQGACFIWQGDFQNAKQLLQAVQRRIKKHSVTSTETDPQTMSKEFYRHRQHQAHKAQLLSRLMVQVEADLSIKLPRAPDLRLAISEAIPVLQKSFLISLRELQGFVGAHEWRKKGLEILALEGRKIHVGYGVFSPIRGEYLDLVARAPLASTWRTAFDIGTGSGVLAAVLAHRGLQKIIATDVDDRAIQCAKTNIKNLGFENQVSVEKTNFFPYGKADLIVCNPPWLPAKPTSAIEKAVYDENSSMVKGFLNQVGDHLNKNGEAWLIISDLAEHLGLRRPHDLTDWISQAKLSVIDCMKIQPRHSKATDTEDALYFARSKEVTMLWRLKQMKFLRLSDPLLSVLYADDDIIAIDKPYGFNAHTNDSKLEHSDAIQDGLIEIYEKQLGHKLHIIHRLDQTTTGVMIFGKSVESAKKYAEYFYNRQVKKTYLFITQNKSEKKSYLINQPIIHKAKELEAETNFKFLKKNLNYELWQANPHTGRNHQIRIHSQAAGLSILGDSKYEGHPYAFLCLHNQRIEFPNGIVILSRPPAYFEDLSILDSRTYAQIYFEADRRERLLAQASPTQCFRLAYKPSAFVLDQFGDTLVLTFLKETWTKAELKEFSTFAASKNKRLILQNLEEKELSWTADEGKIKFELNSDSVGLLLNQRLQRNWVLNQSENKSVLNLFSSTCSYALNAALGRALKVVSVDLNKKALGWGKSYFELNQLQNEAYQFLCRDSLTYLKQCLQKNRTYDLIVCDVPAFFRREKGIFKVENDLEGFIQNCIECLGPEGELLISISYDKIYIDDIRRTIISVQQKLGLANLEINCILPALDFELPNQKATLKSFLVRKKT